MAFDQVDLQYFPQKAAATTPANGGLELVSPKIGVDPGTLQDCLNYEISYEAGYKLADGLLNFGGRSLHTVTRPICGSFTPAPDETVSTIMVGGGGSSVSQDAGWQLLGINPEDGYSIDVLATPGEFGTHGNRISDDGNLLFTARSGQCKIFDIGDPSNVSETDSFSGPTTIVDDARFNPARNRLYVSYGGSFSKRIEFFSVTSGGVLTSIYEADGNVIPNVEGMDISADGTKLAAATGQPSGVDNVRYYDISGDTLSLISSANYSAGHQSIKISPDGNYLLNGHFDTVADGTPYSLWDISGGSMTKSDNFGPAGTHSAAHPNNSSWHPSGEYVAILVEGDKTIRIYSHSSGSLSFVASKDFSEITSVSFARFTSFTKDGNHLIVGFEDDAITVVLDFTDILQGGTSLPTLVTRDDNRFSASSVYTVAKDVPVAAAASSALYVGGEYDAAVTSAPSEVIGRIKILSLSETEVCYQVITGTNVALMGPGEDLRVFPDSSNTEVYATISDREQKVYDDVQDFINFYETLNMNLAAQSGGNCPGSGPVNVLFELDDKVYAARDDDSGNGSKLYTTTDLYQLDKEVEWEAVDMGKEIDFKEGRIKFETALGRIFLEDLPEDEQIQEGDVTELGSIFDSQKTNPNPWNSIGGQSNWTSMESLSEKNESYSRAAVNMGPYFPGSTAPLNSWRDSAKLKVTGFGAAFPTTNLSIKGIEVTVKHKKEASVTDGLDPSDGQARTKAVKLLGVSASANNASATLLGETATTATFGSDSDTWGGDLAHDKVTAKDFGVELQYEVRRAGAGHLFSVSIDVDYIEVKVYYEEGTEQIFFWDGNDDVASGNIIHAFKNDGDYDTEDAEGIFTIYDLNNPEAIVEDLEIRNAANGAGAIMALTAGGAEDVYLPTSEEMEDNKSISQTIKANFYADEDQESIYGVTGAGPAFMFNGEYFVKIRAPIIPEKDRPRHIAEHAQHLVLGYPSGSILVSVVGEPLNFEGVDGASEWGFGDVITGLIGLSGNALGVLCEASTHALMGNNVQNFTTQTISKHTGALEYSVANMGQPMYCDFRGISNIAATERYGDFSWGRLSHNVTKWLQPRLQRSDLHSPSLTKIKGAIPVRNKNQYRLFFRDGYILTMSMFGPAGDAPMFTRQHYGYQNRGSDPTNNLTFVPTVLSSSVLTDGRELSMMGTEDGNIYVLDQGTGITRYTSVSNYHAYMVFNPFNGGEPHLNMKYNEVIVHGQHSGGQELRFSSGTNYLEPESGTFDETRTMGSLSNPLEMDLMPDKVSAHLPNVTDGFSMKIESEADGNLPHIIQALTFRVMPLSDKNAAPRRR